MACGWHSQSFVQIARNDAVLLSGVLQRDIDLPVLRAFFPGQPVLADFEFAPAESDDASGIVEDAVQLAKAGYAVDPEEIGEKTGYRVR